MCKSVALGGQRCPGHAAKALTSAQEKRAVVEQKFAEGDATPKQVATARAKNWKALVDYASTLPGAEQLRNDWAAIGNPASREAKALQGAIDDGALLAQANRKTENEYRASLGKGPLHTPLPLTMEQQEAADALARQQAAEEEARSVDPLGLRQAAQTGQAPAVAPVAPDATPGGPAVAVVPVQRPGLPTQRPGLPVRPPAAATGMAAARVASGQQVRQQKAEEARLAREQRAVEAARVRQERADASQRARDEKAAATQRARTEQAESRRLKAEVSAEVKATRTWVRESGSQKFTAPAKTWAGPAHWQGGQRAGVTLNRDATRQGRVRYGEAYENALRRYAGEYSPADVLSACERLEAQGRERISGQVRHPNWYGGYSTVQDHVIEAARAEAFSKAFGPQETAAFSRKYVEVNLEGVLWRARSNRPPQTRTRQVAMAARKRIAQRWARRRYASAA